MDFIVDCIGQWQGRNFLWTRRDPRRVHAAAVAGMLPVGAGGARPWRPPDSPSPRLRAAELERDRELILPAHIAGPGHAEAGARLGISADASRKAFSRAMVRLASRMPGPA